MGSLRFTDMVIYVGEYLFVFLPKWNIASFFFFGTEEQNVNNQPELAGGV